MSENSVKPSQIRIRTPLQPETNPMNERWEQKWIGTHRIDQISYYLLVGGFNPSEKYEFVSWDDYSQYMGSHKIPWFQTTNQLTINGSIILSCLVFHWIIPATLSFPGGLDKGQRIHLDARSAN